MALCSLKHEEERADRRKREKDGETETEREINGSHGSGLPSLFLSHNIRSLGFNM